MRFVDEVTLLVLIGLSLHLVECIYLQLLGLPLDLKRFCLSQLFHIFLMWSASSLFFRLYFFFAEFAKLLLLYVEYSSGVVCMFIFLFCYCG